LSEKERRGKDLLEAYQSAWHSGTGTPSQDNLELTRFFRDNNDPTRATVIVINPRDPSRHNGYYFLKVACRKEMDAIADKANRYETAHASRIVDLPEEILCSILEKLPNNSDGISGWLGSSKWARARFEHHAVLRKKHEAALLVEREAADLVERMRTLQHAPDPIAAFTATVDEALCEHEGALKFSVRHLANVAEAALRPAEGESDAPISLCRLGSLLGPTAANDGLTRLIDAMSSQLQLKVLANEEVWAGISTCWVSDPAYRSAACLHFMELLKEGTDEHLQADTYGIFLQYFHDITDGFSGGTQCQAVEHAIDAVENMKDANAQKNLTQSIANVLWSHLCDRYSSASQPDERENLKRLGIKVESLFTRHEITQRIDFVLWDLEPAPWHENAQAPS
jgi:hypothetical protein